MDSLDEREPTPPIRDPRDALPAVTQFGKVVLWGVVLVVIARALRGRR